MAYINGKKVLFSANVNIEDIQVVEVINSGYEVSQTINDDDTCDLEITDTGITSSMEKIIEKDITENGTYNASDDGAIGYSSINVNVASQEPTLIAKEITENGTYNASDDSADGYSSINVNLPIYNLTFKAYNTESQTAGYVQNSSQQCLAGQQIILSAIADSFDEYTECTFDGWYQDGVLISTSALFTGFTMPSHDTTIAYKMTRGGTILA